VAAGFLWGFSRPAYQYDGNFVASDYIDRGGAGARRAHADNGQTASAARLMHSDCQFVYSARPGVLAADTGLLVGFQKSA
jgi:hypothetical protein